jgi:hypothetical protein
MLLRHDVIADRETEAGSLAGRLGRKEWLADGMVEEAMPSGCRLQWCSEK